MTSKEKKTFKIYYLAMIFICCIKSNIYGQCDFFHKNRSWMANIGYVYQNNSILELGIKRTSIDKIGNPRDGQWMFSYFKYSYLTLGSEISFNQKTVMTPKIGVGYHFFLVNLDLNIIGYNTNFKEYYPAFVPEIGLSSLFGIIQLNYGYNIYFRDSNVVGNKNRVSLHINYFINDKGWWPWLKSNKTKI